MGNTLLENFKHMDIGVQKRKSQPSKTIVDRTDPTAPEQEGGDRGEVTVLGKIQKTNNAQTSGIQDPSPQQPAPPPPPDQDEAELTNTLEIQKTKLVNQRRLVLLNARETFDAAAFSDPDIYYALLVQGEHAINISTRERMEVTNRETGAVIKSKVVPPNEPVSAA